MLHLGYYINCCRNYDICTKIPINYYFRKEIANIVSAELTSENIIEVKWNPIIDEIEKQHLIELKNLIKELGGGKKMLIYVETYNFMAITSEAREYASSSESSEFTLANAVLVDSLGKKLLFNFFMNITKPVVPTKGFNSKEEAIKWLKTFNYSSN